MTQGANLVTTGEDNPSLFFSAVANSSIVEKLKTERERFAWYVGKP
jgi:hypothetical protein